MSDYFSCGLPPCFGCGGGSGPGHEGEEHTNDDVPGRVPEDVDDPPQETGVDSRTPVAKLDVPGGVPDIPSGDTRVEQIPDNAARQPTPPVGARNSLKSFFESRWSNRAHRAGENPAPTVQQPVAPTAPVQKLHVPDGDTTHVEQASDHVEQTSDQIEQTSDHVKQTSAQIEQTSDHADRPRPPVVGARNSALKGFFESCWGSSHRAGSGGTGDEENPIPYQAAADDAKEKRKKVLRIMMITMFGFVTAMLLAQHTGTRISPPPRLIIADGVVLLLALFFILLLVDRNPSLQCMCFIAVIMVVAVVVLSCLFVATLLKAAYAHPPPPPPLAAPVATPLHP